MKLAAITNVTINGDTVTIAVQTDTGEESVEIPIGEDFETAPPVDELMPEEDMTGEGLENNLNTPVDVALQAPLASGNKQKKMASTSKISKTKRTAQAPMGGGVPGTPGEGAGGSGASENALPGASPTGGDPIQNLTTGDPLAEGGDEIPTAGEQQMPYAICPECGSSDVDVQKVAAGGIEGNCNNCGAGYEALIKKAIEFKIVKPTRSVGEEGSGSAPDEPEVPALPVAAQTRIDKDTITRIASNKEKHGHVCPACGMNQCKASKEKGGSAEYTCPACHTDIVKDMLISASSPDKGVLRVSWDLIPNLEGCDECKDAAAKFVSMAKVEGMIKQAQADGTTEFPTANCMELVARRWGGNSVASFGPCKGKPLADCVCSKLKEVNLRTARHVEKLASAMTQEDPMDECVADQQKNGYDVKEAKSICNCLKQKHAAADSDNIFAQAFAEDVQSGKEKVLTAQDLSTINSILFEEEIKEEAKAEDDVDLADVKFEDQVVAEVKIKETVKAQVAQAPSGTGGGECHQCGQPGVKAQNGGIVCGQKQCPNYGKGVDVVSNVPSAPDQGDTWTASTEKEVVEAEATEKIEETISPEEEKNMALAMQTHKLRRVGEDVVKIAATPTQVKDIEGDVEAGVPRSSATMGNEGADNIDVPMASPSVPRAKATMGQEGADNIDVAAGLPDVAVDSSYMGVEQSLQSNMPAINNEIKGTVIAKKLKEVDTVEGDVEAGVPRSKATIGNEGADNIDVPMASPSVPRAKATMGQEGADNIDVAADAPDVPVDSAYMGKEKETQKDMPAINDEYLKLVQQEKKGVQLERIANARWKEAVKISSKLLATGRITEEAYDDVVNALSANQLDQIEIIANKMYPKRATKVASSQTSVSSDVHSGAAIVIEARSVEDPTPTLADGLSRHLLMARGLSDEDLEGLN